MNNFQSFIDKNINSIRLSDAETHEEGLTGYDLFKEIREEIIFLRHMNSLTQKELAERSGLTQANISKIEKGTTKPTIDSLRRIARATGTRLVIEFLDTEGG